MNWTDVEHCTPWTFEDVLCEVEVEGTEDCKYIVARYVGRNWLVHDLGRVPLGQVIFRGKVKRWCHIHK